MSFISYAQNFEDVLLHRVFAGQGTGFYVDVGACHPVEGSVTKSFYDRGWSGINIEPGLSFPVLAKERPRDINLQMAVMDRRGEIEFVDDEVDPGMSHVAIEASPGTKSRTVPCDTLEAIVQAHSNGRPVDFIKVDVEGAEPAIVLSTNWRQLRPRVLLFEATLPWSTSIANQHWEPRLLEQGYVRVYFDGINCFYIPAEQESALLQHFQVPVNVLDRVEPYELVALRTQRDTQQRVIEQLNIDVHRTRTECDQLRLAAAQLGQLQVAVDDERRKTGELADQAVALRSALSGRETLIEQLTAERASLAAERDALTAKCDVLTAKCDALTVKCDSMAAKCDALTVKCDSMAAERDSLVAERDSLAAERSVLTAERDSLANAAERGIQADDGHGMPANRDAAASQRPPSRFKDLGRQGALLAYRSVRPVVRPLAWRVRTFLVSGVSEQLQHLSPVIPPSPAACSEDWREFQNLTSEMRELAAEMERVMMTLALERSAG